MATSWNESALERPHPQGTLICNHLTGFLSEATFHQRRHRGVRPEEAFPTVLSKCTLTGNVFAGVSLEGTHSGNLLLRRHASGVDVEVLLEHVDEVEAHMRRDKVRHSRAEGFTLVEA